MSGARANPSPPPRSILSWRLVLRRDVAPPTAPPTRLLTRSGAFRHESIPAEIAMLLPSGDGPTDLVDAVAAQPAFAQDAILGLFLASPLINVAITAERLARAGVSWVANLPSVSQQDEEFSRQLVDVGLDAGREFANLARFRERGFHIAAAVSHIDSARSAADIMPEMIIVTPRVADYAAGFPSLRQRASALQAVREVLDQRDWTGLLIGLGANGEADSEGVWPPRADGLLCRSDDESERRAR